MGDCMFKRLLKLPVILAFLMALSMSAMAVSDADITVHITATGHKYHKAGCRYLRQSDYKVSLKEAKERGLDPCKVCKPPK